MSLITRPARVLIRRAVRRYGPGPELRDALDVAERLREHGHGVVLAYWDPPDITPDAAADAALAAFDAARHRELDAHVAVKAPAFGPPWEALRITNRLARRARVDGLRLHFDALGPETAIPTLGLLRTTNRAGADVGLTLPASWPRSHRDAERAIGADLAVRLVRGQWPQLDRDDETRSFLALGRRLAGQVRHLAIATHSPEIVAELLPIACEFGTPTEVQLLYGLPGGRVRQIAASYDVPVRVYVPWGHLDLPYDPARARDTGRVAWWLARDAFRAREGALGWTLEGA